MAIQWSKSPEKALPLLILQDRVGLDPTKLALVRRKPLAMLFFPTSCDFGSKEIPLRRQGQVQDLKKCKNDQDKRGEGNEIPMRTFISGSIHAIIRGAYYSHHVELLIA